MKWVKMLGKREQVMVPTKTVSREAKLAKKEKDNSAVRNVPRKGK